MSFTTTALQPVKKKSAAHTRVAGAENIASGVAAGETDAHKILAKLKRELDYLHNSFDTVTDPILIDSYIYEILSVNMKYQYYLKLCKSKTGLSREVQP